MKYVYFLKYNNYANRIMKKGATLEDYLGENSVNYITSITDVKMWNPNDGIQTVITTPNNTDFSTEPDYLLAVNEDLSIDSRWFVVETVRWHKGQYQCKLRRDVFAEAWDDLMNSTSFIDRAILQATDPLIYNPEPITVNQINQNEVLIKDRTQCPWIVFYGESVPVYEADDPDGNYHKGDQITVTVSREDINYDETTPNITTFCSNHTFKYFPNDEYDIQMDMLLKLGPSGGNKNYKFHFVPNGLVDDTEYTGHQITTDGYVSYTTDAPSLLATFCANAENDPIKKYSDYQNAKKYNNKIVYDTTGQKYYLITVVPSVYFPTKVRLTNESLETNPFLVKAQDVLEDNTDFYDKADLRHDSISGGDFVLYYRYQVCTMYAHEIETKTVTARVPTASYVPTDNPYFVWCMPYGEIPMEVENQALVYSDGELNLRIANAMARAFSQNKIWDFQILPFCPLPDEFFKSGTTNTIKVTNNNHVTDTGTMVDNNNQPLGYVFSCPSSSFSRQITFGDGKLIRFGNPKIDTLCRKYRLYSPNYASTFEFDVMKNNGLMGFNVRCTYLPFNPYIRVSPMWEGLYGTNEDEVRGLVCSGDFSLPRLNDQWVNYQEQNVNMYNIFAREINHMDVQRKYERGQQIASGIAGIFTGIAGGAATGKYVGGGAGAVAGGIIGGLTSAAAGAADVALSEGMYNENRAYATEMHELQLGNIQAMPVSLAKTTAFNIDNRYFPVFTIYSCTNIEEDRVREYIRQYSMNVGVVGIPGQYVNNYYDLEHGYEPRGFMQGTILQIDTKFDTHFVDELNNEFQKGVRLR